MKTLVIGLGNPILGDDGLGWRVADEVAKIMEGPPFDPAQDRPEVEVDCASLGGLSLMERLTGYERVILIDAIYTGQKPIGTISRFTLNDVPDLTAGHSASAHDTSLRTALNVGRSMNIDLPADENVTVVAIEAENVYDFSEKLSPPIEAAVPVATEKVLELLNLKGEKP
jgi:hydrogenase maturation protease